VYEGFRPTVSLPNRERGYRGLIITETLKKPIEMDVDKIFSYAQIGGTWNGQVVELLMKMSNSWKATASKNKD
jgi:hypothetical protein